MRAAILLVLVSSTTASAAPWLWKKSGTYVNDVAVAPDGSVAVYAGNEIVLLGGDGKPRMRDESFDGRSATVQSMAFAPGGDLVVAGYFHEAMSLHGKELTASNHDDEGVIARYAPDGTLRWSTVIPAGTSDSIELHGVAASKIGVLAVGRAMPKHKDGKLDEASGGGFVVLLDGQGAVKRRAVLDPGMDNMLRSACASDAGFVVVGEQRANGSDESTIVHGLAADGSPAWSYASKDSKGERVACLGDHAFATSHSDDQKLSVVELDRAGKVVRTIVADTKGRTETLSIAANASELAISTRAQNGDSVASRLSRYARDGKLIKTDEYASKGGDDPIWIRAAYGPKGLVLAGEVEKTAKATIRGHELGGPTLFVIGP